ncbi:MAG: retroviral-like aspartic protease family protein [Thermoanaerobaculia bacterium]
MRFALKFATLAGACFLMSCSLYKDVSVTPLLLMPGDIAMRGVAVPEMVEAGEFARAAAQAARIDEKENPSPRDLAALGRAELACGRLDAARRHLRAALDLKPFHADIGDIGWSISQTEYLANNFAAAYDWAKFAEDHGLSLKQWHLDYLKALSNVQINRISWPAPVRVPLNIGNPDVPRIDVDVNDLERTSGVIDSGAVLTIVSQSFAKRAEIRPLGDFRGTFYGLLGEPIEVRFGMIDGLKIGDLLVENVPVAIMPDEKLSFFVSKRQPFKMDLLVGVNLLKEFRLEFDYPQEMVTLTPLTTKDRNPAPDQNLFFVGFRPFVYGTINRKGWYLFVLDTGSEVTFLNEGQLGMTNIRGLPRFHGATLQGLGGAQKRGAKVENVQIGVDRWAGDFRTLPLYGNEQSNSIGILGENFLQNFRVVIDFGTMRMELHRK